jgi:multiple antibiotic resistance protein
MEDVIKSILTLFALTDPVALVPLLMASIAKLSHDQQKEFVRTLSLFVFVSLLTVGLVGNLVLSALGVSMGAMRVAGGISALVAGVQLMLASPLALESQTQPVRPSLSPLGIPMLVGPAAMSFMIANSSTANAVAIAKVAIAPATVALATYLIFRLALKLGKWMGPDAITVTEKISAFLLSALAVEMIVSGLKLLFPAIADGV